MFVNAFACVTGEEMSRLSKEEKGDMDASSLFTEDEKISICIQHSDR